MVGRLAVPCGLVGANATWRQLLNKNFYCFV